MPAAKKKSAAKKTKAVVPEVPEQEQKQEPYRPRRRPLKTAGWNHRRAEKQRQNELAKQRAEHNRRTGDASL